MPPMTTVQRDSLQDAPVVALGPDGLPDWERAPDDVVCPLCEYNLRGLREPRCPECGYAFLWRDVLDPRRRKHPYLFEHHPEDNLRSYWRTFRGAMRPGTFWSELNPVQPSNRARLLAYWLIGALTFLMVLGLQRAVTLVAIMMNLRGRAPLLLSGRTLVDWDDVVADVLTWGLFPLLWMPATVLALTVFWISMRRARIRRSHVLRCVIYSADPMFWSALLLVAFMPPVLSLVLAPSLLYAGVVLYPLLFVAIVIACLHRLITAYRLYLQFDHPALTVLAAQVIVALAAANLAFFLFPWEFAALLRWLGVR